MFDRLKLRIIERVLWFVLRRFLERLQTDANWSGFDDGLAQGKLEALDEVHDKAYAKGEKSALAIADARHADELERAREGHAAVLAQAVREADEAGRIAGGEARQADVDRLIKRAFDAKAEGQKVGYELGKADADKGLREESFALGRDDGWMDALVAVRKSVESLAQPSPQLQPDLAAGSLASRRPDHP